MQRLVFPIFSLVIFTGFFLGFLFFYNYFDGADGLRVELLKTARVAEKNRLKALIAAHEVKSFQQHVALHIPNQEKLNQSYPLRNLASVVGEHDPDVLNLEKASTLFESGRTLFRQKQFGDSNSIFKNIIENYTSSIHLVESYFLLIEGLYQSRQYEACAEYADRMVTLFPESELTGFALLRMGAVYQERERLEDAAEIYRLVAKTYSTPSLAAQAQALLSGLEK